MRFCRRYGPVSHGAFVHRDKRNSSLWQAAGLVSESASASVCWRFALCHLWYPVSFIVLSATTLLSRICVESHSLCVLDGAGLCNSLENYLKLGLSDSVLLFA